MSSLQHSCVNGIVWKLLLGKITHPYHRSVSFNRLAAVKHPPVIFTIYSEGSKRSGASAQSLRKWSASKLSLLADKAAVKASCRETPK